eukprot:TRINITY_DN880_c6_g1_i1.p1 TRINITY_DN880_c6_g1~~TRINITY_DN880_c6_g1_i1.p1  ORF type:complete len:323 (+),score=87.42 TRINITY_DN880_c6_g1_i1:128-970(+)
MSDGSVSLEETASVTLPIELDIENNSDEYEDDLDFDIDSDQTSLLGGGAAGGDSQSHHTDSLGINLSRGIKERLLEREYNVNTASVFYSAFSLYKKHWVFFTGYGILATLICIISIFTAGVPLLLFIPLNAGLQTVVLNLIRTSGYPSPFYPDFLIPLKNILPLLLVTLIQAVAVACGFVLLALPGIYLFVALSFSTLILLEYIDTELSFFDTLLISEKVVRKKWFKVAIVHFILALAFIFGSFFIVVIPFVQIASCYLFKDIFGLRDHHQYMVGRGGSA